MDSNANALCEIVLNGNTNTHAIWEIVCSSITKMLAFCDIVILCQGYHKNAFKNSTIWNPKLPSSKHKYHKVLLVSLNSGLFVTQAITHHDETLLRNIVSVYSFHLDHDQ